ncbi:hypothetical protein [Xylocopilactobacillus apicola]|uniref:DUF4145 domain-containing protein n=1 Tax=Xylocopilactobacillus apicola TaxID=2932184 RepID=A0AAU9DTA5_9LACO|nr:hypothetical protein [Xylocopilactobacillus apicola]BDR59344.1 hypothetical protein XA3_17850 [Xylocopilactobacillus apicola]
MNTKEISTLQEMKNIYNKELKKLQVNEENNYFYWKQDRFLDIWIIHYKKSYKNIFFDDWIGFAYKSIKSDKLHLLNIDDEKTLSLRYSNAFGSKEILGLLIQDGILSIDLENAKLISSSLQGNRIFPQNNSNKTIVECAATDWVYSFFNAEYTEATNKLNTTETQINFNFEQNKFFVDQFEIPKIINTIKDPEFKDELTDSLWAYEKGHWFLAAAGLGTCLEFILDLTVVKHYGRPKSFPNDPTLSDYLNQLKQPPISLNIRDVKFLKSIFMLRNSVDHHNKGKTSKQMCDSLLGGIAHVFNEYYQSEK